ncbi:hypothetical protein BVG16_03130 [Paenibacillus selenitireducens]|uniref:DUF1440 domain-containing protein n=1 Tax=Paenibacillus selenitireducens TaxID=1324314 RepID=A0A1T2XP04_9BACL|nr:hypothetical protein BVG16_03130 [Paenibacillus selenitireducens]
MIQHEQQKSSTLTNPVLYSLQIGFFAGLIWGGFRWFFFVFQFTTVLPGYLAEPFYKHSFLLSNYGHLVGWGYFTLFSILATMLYTFVLRKLKGAWPGLIYGVAWWSILYGAVGPMLGMMKPLNKMSWSTVTTEFCVFLLWGLFIGYSVAVEYTDERGREPGDVEKNQNLQPGNVTNS